MLVDATPNTAPFNTKFFPQHVLLLSTGENMMPMGYWTVISKEPFRFLICMQLGNYSLGLLREYKEAALHFSPPAFPDHLPEPERLGLWESPC